MDSPLQYESERLARSWQRHETTMLRHYLVSGVEDPRLNVQSVLTRHFLASVLFGTRYRELMEAELRFAMAMNWLLVVADEAVDANAWTAVEAAFSSGADNAEGILVPAHIHRIRQSLPAMVMGQSIPDYLGEAIRSKRAGEPGPWEASGSFSTCSGDVVRSGRVGGPDLEVADSVRSPGGPWAASPVLGTFVRAWRTALAEEPLVEPRPQLLEPACGSANDFRVLEAAGLARFFAYTGLDLSEKNISNARTWFPQTRFVVGNVFQIPAGDAEFDYGVVHDLFEHLSPDALEVAIAELCRVTRSGLCLGFFQVDEVDEHIIRPVDEYHVNTLSLARLMEAFSRHGFEGEALHIGTFLRLRFGCPQTHNPNAYTLVLARNPAAAGQGTP